MITTTMDNMMMMMPRYFVVSSELNHFLFKGWSASGIPSWIGLCMAVVGLTLLLEAGRLLKGYLLHQANINPLTYAQTERNMTERSPLIRPLMIPTSASHIKRRKIKLHVMQTVTHLVQLVIGYTLMLAVMSYNFWVILSVVCASAIGYLVFGAVYDVYWRPIDPPPAAPPERQGNTPGTSTQDPTLSAANNPAPEIS